MDIWVAIEPKMADNLVAVLRGFGFDVPKLESSLFLNDDKVIRIGLLFLRVELLTTISGVNFDRDLPIIK